MQYAEFEKMLLKAAWSFSRTTGIDYKILKSEADLAFVIACNKYSDHEFKFSTYLHICLRNHLSNFSKSQLGNIKTKTDLNLDMFVSESPDQEERLMRKEAIDNASDNFKKMLKIILKNHKRFMQMKPRNIRGELINDLMKLGLSRWAVEVVFREARAIVADWR